MSDFSMLKILNEYLEKAPSSFHTPGHKGGGVLSPLTHLRISHDLTELPNTGSLFDGDGLTAEAEKALSSLFGTKASFLSAGGCTLPIQAMLRLALPQGGKILCSRMLHRSAVNAMALLDIEPVWILPDKSAGECFSGRVNPDEVAIMLNEYSVQAVYITSPDYFGVISDVRSISEICTRHNIPLLVDNAHGSHLFFLKGKLHPLQNGATLCADSAHKTLPVLTGGAWLHVNDEKYVQNAREAMSLFGSTSPSYLTLLSLDLCREWLLEVGMKPFEDLCKNVSYIKELMCECGFIFPLGEIDPLRIAAVLPQIDNNILTNRNSDNPLINGFTFAEYLRKHGIEAEFADEKSIILIPSPLNREEDFSKLANALTDLPIYDTCANKSSRTLEFHSPKALLSPREALLSPSKTVAIQESFGKIAAQTVCNCPPGIPICIQGEIIDEKTLAALQKYGIGKIKIVI